MEDKMKLYSDLEKHYVLLEFHRSHSQLLIRCLSSEIDKRDYNIDIIFKPVTMMILPDTFEGIEISVFEDDEIPEFLINDFGFTVKLGCKIFLIKDREGNFYYVNAMLMGVYHNQLGQLESGWDKFGYHLGEEKMLFK